MLQRSAQSGLALPPHPYVWAFSEQAPDRQQEQKLGPSRIVDSRNFNVSTTTAAALVTVKPGGVRELHWHPNADEWQYYLKGEARMTVFDTGPAAATADFRAGDIGYVKKEPRALRRGIRAIPTWCSWRSSSRTTMRKSHCPTG